VADTDFITEPLGGDTHVEDNKQSILSPLYEQETKKLDAMRAEKSANTMRLIDDSIGEDVIAATKGNLLLTNNDETVNKILDDQDEKAAESARAKVSQIILSDASDEEKIEQATEVKRQLDESPRPTLDSTLKVTHANTPGLDAGTNITQEWLAANNPAEFGTANLKEHEMVAAGQVFADTSFAQSIISYPLQTIAKGLLPGFAVRINNMVNRSLTSIGQPGVSSISKPGDSLIRLRQAMRDLPPEQSKQLISNTLEEIRDTSTWIFRDDIEAVELIEFMLTNYEATDDQLANEAALMNAMALADIIPFGTPIVKKLGGAFIKKLPRSAARQLEQANSARAARELEEALTDSTGEAANRLGTTNEQIISDNILPDASGSVPRAGADSTARAMSESDPFAAEILYTTPEIVSKQRGVLAEVKQRVTGNARDIQTTEPVVHIPRIETKVAEDGSGIEAKFRISGNGAHYGSNTVDDVLESAAMFDDAIDAGEVTVLSRNLGSGEFEPVGVAKLVDGEFRLPEAITEQGEYLAEINRKFEYNGKTDSLGLNDTNIGFGGRVSKWLNFSSQFDEQTRIAWNNVTLATQAESNRLKHILDPFFRLKGKTSQGAIKQARVLEILDEAERAGNDITPRQLMEMSHGDEDVANAVLAFRDLGEEIYRRGDAKLIREMEGVGAKIIKGGDQNPDEFKELATPLARENVAENLKGVRSVYDVQTGRVIGVGDADDLANLGNVVKFRRPVKTEERTLNYGLVTTADGIEDLPKQGLLRKFPWWTPKKYAITHKLMVRNKTQNIDGNIKSVDDGTLAPDEGWSTLKVENGKGALLQYKERLIRDSGDEVEYDVVEARELRDFSGDETYQHFSDSGSLIFSKRGEERTGIGGERKLAGTLESFEAAIGMASRSMGTDLFVEKQIASWEKRFSKTLGIKKIPLTGDIPRPEAHNLLEEWKQAVASRDLIAMTAGVDSSTYNRITRKLTTGLGNFVVGSGNGSARNMMSKFLFNRVLSQSMPNTLKNTAFGVYLGLNPQRQAVMQAQQASIYLNMDGGAKYLFSGNATKDFTGLSYYLGRRTISKKAHDKALDDLTSDLSGSARSERKREIKRLADAWDKISPAIDSHVFMNTMSVDPRANTGVNFGSMLGPTASMVTRGAVSTENAVKKVVRASTALGFKAGEQFQLTNAFLFAKNRWQVRNPDIADKWDAPRNIEKIVSQTQDVALNPTFKLAGNQGLLGVFLQFSSHAQKAVQALIPRKIFETEVPLGKLGSEAFSNREKARMAVTQSVLYGAPFIGGSLSLLWDETVEKKDLKVSDENNRRIKEFINQGAIGSVVNHGFRWFDDEGEWSQLDFNFGPVEGVLQNSPIAKIYSALITTDEAGVEQILGAAGGLLGQAATTLDDLAMIFRLPEVPEDESKYIMMLERAARLAPIYGNVYKSRLLEGAANNFATASGSPGARIKGRGEMLAKAMLGLRSETEVGGFEAAGKIFDEKEHLADTAKKFVKQFERIGVNPEDYSEQELREFVTGSYSGWREAYGDTKAMMIMERVRELAFNNPRKNDPHPIYTMWFNYIMSGKLVPTGDTVKDVKRTDPTHFGGETNKQEFIEMLETHLTVNQDLIDGRDNK
jgi:hypothetical protein